MKQHDKRPILDTLILVRNEKLNLPEQYGYWLKLADIALACDGAEPFGKDSRPHGKSSR
jgi:hypothetical protein